MEKKIFELTEEGLLNLQTELTELKDVARPANIIALQEARAQGDLSENADYDAARDEQARIEQRILELEDIIKNHKIIKVKSNVSGESVVELGRTVVIKVLNKEVSSYLAQDNNSVKNGDEFTYSLVGTIEANPFNGKVSNECPFGDLLIGAKVGEERTIVSETGFSYNVKVIEIK